MRISDWSSDVCSSDLAATAIVTGHILAICGGTPSTVARAGTPPVETRSIAYDPALAETLGGIAIPAERQQAILEALGFAVATGTPWHVTVPSWRRGLARPPDVVGRGRRVHGRAPLPP